MGSANRGTQRAQRVGYAVHAHASTGRQAYSRACSLSRRRRWPPSAARSGSVGSRGLSAPPRLHPGKPQRAVRQGIATAVRVPGRPTHRALVSVAQQHEQLPGFLRRRGIAAALLALPLRSARRRRGQGRGQPPMVDRLWTAGSLHSASKAAAGGSDTCTPAY